MGVAQVGSIYLLFRGAHHWLTVITCTPSQDRFWRILGGHTIDNMTQQRNKRNKKKIKKIIQAHGGVKIILDKCGAGMEEEKRERNFGCKQDDDDVTTYTHANDSVVSPDSRTILRHSLCFFIIIRTFFSDQTAVEKNVEKMTYANMERVSQRRRGALEKLRHIWASIIIQHAKVGEYYEEYKQSGDIPKEKTFELVASLRACLNAIPVLPNDGPLSLILLVEQDLERLEKERELVEELCSMFEREKQSNSFIA